MIYIMIEHPRDSGFTFYSITNCTRCKVSETLLKEQYGITYFSYVLCDDYIKQDKQMFIEEMRELMNSPTIKTIQFPIIFFNGEYKKTSDILK